VDSWDTHLSKQIALALRAFLKPVKQYTIPPWEEFATCGEPLKNIERDSGVLVDDALILKNDYNIIREHLAITVQP
jgi:hypothetical protein